MVKVLGFRVQVLGLKQGLRVQGSGFRVQEFAVQWRIKWKGTLEMKWELTPNSTRTPCRLEGIFPN